MNSRLKAVLFLVVVAAVAAAACLLTGHWLRGREQHVDLHAWVHDQLGLTDEQEEQIEQTEAQFQARRRELLQQIKNANAELARAMLESRDRSPKVAEAVEKIHHAQSELQKATIDHVFEMKPALRPDQYDKLLKLTAEALTENP